MSIYSNKDGWITSSTEKLTELIYNSDEMKHDLLEDSFRGREGGEAKAKDNELVH